MRPNKLALLAGAAPVALAFALASSPAAAFDNVEWSWTEDVFATINKAVNVDIEVEPTGMVTVQKLQVNVGDVTATSTVSGFENNQPSQGGTAGVDENFEVIVSYDGNTNLVTGGSFIGLAGDEDLTVSLAPDPNGSIDENNNQVLFDINVSGNVDVVASDTFDALTELPTIVSSATAVANNQSITSDVALQLHDGQFAVGSLDDANGGGIGIINGDENGEGPDGNIFHDLAFLGLVSGVSPAEISATSTVSDILNAGVDSSATAVANNMNISLEGEGGNQFMIADITQLAIANTSALSSVTDVSLNNYTNLGSVNPVISSSATAVGNNVNISVSGPAIVTP